MANHLATFGNGSMDDKPYEQPCFQLILRALPRAVPVMVRLRRLLKACLRCYGFQCVDACELRRQVGKEPPSPPAQGS